MENKGAAAETAALYTKEADTMFRPMRRFKQALPEEECRKVLEAEKRGTLALAGDEGYPYALPINYYYHRETGQIGRAHV